MHTDVLVMCVDGWFTCVLDVVCVCVCEDIHAEYCNGTRPSPDSPITHGAQRESFIIFRASSKDTKDSSLRFIGHVRGWLVHVFT